MFVANTRYQWISRDGMMCWVDAKNRKIGEKDKDSWDSPWFQAEPFYPILSGGNFNLKLM